MKVDFLIAGTQKGGTSSLQEYLRNHPEICMANEAHFFDREKAFSRKRVNYSAYHRNFHRKGQQWMFGEKTPIYMYWYSAPRRIWQYNPDIKWVLLLRNPIERAYSHWKMMCERNDENLDFWSAIQNEHIRCQAALPFQHRWYSYVDRGFYTEQLRRIWFYFPKEQTLILKSEELKASPITSLDKVCRFLGVQSFGDVRPLSVRSQDDGAPIGECERQYLAKKFEYEIRELERLLDWDCSDWLN